MSVATVTVCVQCDPMGAIQERPCGGKQCVWETEPCEKVQLSQSQYEQSSNIKQVTASKDIATMATE